MAAPLDAVGPDVYAKLSIATHVFSREDTDVAQVLDELESVFTRAADRIVPLVRSSENDPRLARLQRLQRELGAALQKEQFALLYQPYVDRSRWRWTTYPCPSRV